MRPRVAILGTGLIGGSLGMAIRANHAASAVIGWDCDVATGAMALERGAADQLADSAEEAVSNAEVVFLAPPIEVIIPLLRAIEPALPSTTVVTDVGSAKERIVFEAHATIGGRFVGGHPMAGHEEFGIAWASPTLFQEAAWVLTPVPHTDPAALDVVARLVESIGARPRVCAPKTHDSLIAFLSHLPHLLAYGLADSAGHGVPDEWTDLAAGSFRDGARVALSDPERWVEILLDNREATVQSLDAFLAWASQAKNALANGDRGRLVDLLRAAHQGRRRFLL
jgi:prephenate dehydrogenase